MSKKDTIYCNRCGKKESIHNERCQQCNSLLNDKDHELREYILDKLKDDLEGETIDKISSFIKAFIKKYCYGFILSAAIIFTGVTIIIDDKKMDYESNTSRPTVNSEYGYKFLLGCWDTEDHMARYMFLPNREEFVIGYDGEYEGKINYNWLWMPYYDISKDQNSYNLDLYYKDDTDIEPVYSHSSKFNIIDDEHIVEKGKNVYKDDNGNFITEEKDYVFKRVDCQIIINEVPTLEEYLKGE